MVTTGKITCIRYFQECSGRIAILYFIFRSLHFWPTQQIRNGNVLVTLPECFQKHQWFCRELTAKHERAAVVFLPLFFLLRSEQRSKRIWSFKIVKDKFRKAQMPFQNLAICKP